MIIAIAIISIIGIDNDSINDQINDNNNNNTNNNTVQVILLVNMFNTYYCYY